ncbi:DUF4340 domain-containing protein [Thiorhodococcus mannitoliphagus]|uniref:DUF4340 domain-containing protein n=1 Tax=Thiorhodococcus mannitoliphagus TaxID=329406 RepID=A0A6P1DX80_9GAMM|nr:DUF4340 domain-containing protein [Thiorhodococcus mannitoliphagus]NEX20314.1 DUF4340 domain-containing protein [Thiorhodococcus mannitoliphagus]
MNQLKTSKADLRWGQDLRSPLIMGLLLVLALQLLIALGQSLSKPGMAALNPQTPLVAVDPEQVTSITIEGSDEGERVTLSRKGEEDGWVIAELADLPVTTSKVDLLLKQLADLKRPLPVGTSEASLKRFKVADDDFVRRLTVATKDGEAVTLILGETPGFRRLYGRPDGDDAVYDLPLALSDISSRRDDWSQTGLLSLDAETIAAISGQDWTLTKSDDGWTLDDSDEPLDEDAAKDVVMKLAGLRYRGVLGIADDPAYKQQEPVLEIGLRLDDGSTKTYRVSKAEDSEDYVLKSDAMPYYFKLSEYDLEGLLDLERSKLIVQPEPTEEEQPPAPVPAAEVEPSAKAEPGPEVEPSAEAEPGPEVAPAPKAEPSAEAEPDPKVEPSPEVEQTESIEADKARRASEQPASPAPEQATAPTPAPEDVSQPASE